MHDISKNVLKFFEMSRVTSQKDSVFLRCHACVRLDAWTHPCIRARARATRVRGRMGAERLPSRTSPGEPEPLTVSVHQLSQGARPLHGRSRPDGGGTPPQLNEPRRARATKIERPSKDATCPGSAYVDFVPCVEMFTPVQVYVLRVN